MGNDKRSTPIISPLNANNLKTHLRILSSNDSYDLNLIKESGTNESDMDIAKLLAIEDHEENEENDDDEQYQDNIPKINVNETYDGFLSALGAEIQRQQKREHENKKKLKTKSQTTIYENHDIDSKSLQNYNIRINDIDINRFQRKSYSGYLNVFDLPATPPLSSCDGVRSEGSEYNINDIDDDDVISVNSDTMR